MTVDLLLLETGGTDKLLLESGGNLLLESSDMTPVLSLNVSDQGTLFGRLTAEGRYTDGDFFLRQ